MLAGYDFIGFFDKSPLSFSDVDFDLVQRPEHRDRVESFFGKSKHRFRIWFHNAYWNYLYDPGGVFTEVERMWLLMGNLDNPKNSILTRSARIDYFLPGITPDPDAINIVFTGNATGIPKIPLTPHMMAHRIGHLYTLYPTCYRPVLRSATRLLRDAYGHTEHLVTDSHGADLYCWGETADPVSIQLNAILKGITTTRAGRAKRVLAWDYTAEWMAQYISTGEIKFAEIAPYTINPSEVFQEDTNPPRNLCKNVGSIEPLVAVKDYPMGEIKEIIEDGYERALNHLKGKVFVT